MSNWHRASICGLGLALLVVIGCGQRLNVEKTIKLDVGDVNEISVDAPSGEQKVSVEVSSSASEINVYVVLEENLAHVKANVQSPDPAKVLAGKAKIKEETLEATIPAGKKYAVVIGAARKPTEVKLKVVGK